MVIAPDTFKDQIIGMPSKVQKLVTRQMTAECHHGRKRDHKIKHQQAALHGRQESGRKARSFAVCCWSRKNKMTNNTEKYQEQEARAKTSADYARHALLRSEALSSLLERIAPVKCVEEEGTTLTARIVKHIQPMVRCHKIRK